MTLGMSFPSDARAARTIYLSYDEFLLNGAPRLWHWRNNFRILVRARTASADTSPCEISQANLGRGLYPPPLAALSASNRRPPSPDRSDAEPDHYASESPVGRSSSRATGWVGTLRSSDGRMIPLASPAISVERSQWPFGASAGPGPG